MLVQSFHIVYLDVESVLKDLQQNYKLALVTNGVPQLQRDKLKSSKLGVYFDAVIISGELGIGKPDPKIFEAALSQLGTRPETAVMVGNSLKADIAGAKQVDIKAVWLNRDRKENDNFIKPDYEVNDMNELRHVLNDLD